MHDELTRPGRACAPEDETEPPSLSGLAPRKTREPRKHRSRARAFMRNHFPEASVEDWNSWQWQLANRISDIDMLSRVIRLTDDERDAFHLAGGKLPVSITPYYASLLDPLDAMQPLRRSVVPVSAELFTSEGEENDPLHEESTSPTPCLVHRYPDRVLFLVTGFCSVTCRYCTRSRMVNRHDTATTRAHWEEALTYIRSHEEIRDVIISGGDPLTLADGTLNWLLGEIRAIPYVEMIRIGTKVPFVLPQRITPDLVRILARYRPLFMSIHATHPAEHTPESARALDRLARAGIPLGSQTVLLRGVNDDAATMKKLMHGLLMNSVRPYYLYQCDPITGSAHFRTPVETGLSIIQQLRGFTSGYAVPTFVIDAPGGGGKIPVTVQHLTGRTETGIELVNYEGRAFSYPERGLAPREG